VVNDEVVVVEGAAATVVVDSLLPTTWNIRKMVIPSSSRPAATRNTIRPEYAPNELSGSTGSMSDDYGRTDNPMPPLR
jgi:hypothetical protein